MANQPYGPNSDDELYDALPTPIVPPPSHRSAVNTFLAAMIGVLLLVGVGGAATIAANDAQAIGTAAPVAPEVPAQAPAKNTAATVPIPTCSEMVLALGINTDSYLGGPLFSAYLSKCQKSPRDFYRCKALVADIRAAVEDPRQTTYDVDRAMTAFASCMGSSS